MMIDVSDSNRWFKNAEGRLIMFELDYCERCGCNCQTNAVEIQGPSHAFFRAVKKYEHNVEPSMLNWSDVLDEAVCNECFYEASQWEDEE